MIDKMLYQGNDLGCTYSFKKSTFVVWAPLAASVSLKLETSRNRFSIIEMEKGKDGAFFVSVKGNLLRKKYCYLINNDGLIYEAIDPYGKGISLNSQYSAVVDIERVKKIKKVTPSKILSSVLDTSIYEVNIRDFTEDKHTSITKKGKYLGFVEEKRKTRKGNPAGIDYLKYLGISHVQLQPVMDFFGSNDENLEKYNWGYNPLSYFALEGSFSSKPHDPQYRLLEFKKMVSVLHKNNIRVILDVVYNHVYEYHSSCFEKIVPGYYFRVHKDGSLSMASGCGNDVASEKPMVRKMILDSLRYFVEVFDVDGFRFDLMGLTDIETLLSAEKMLKEIKPDIILYGEGWNMDTALTHDKRGSLNNSKKIPDFGFFNDSFRDFMKGPTFRDHIREKGFINGQDKSAEEVKDYLFGSLKAKGFSFAHQSINYVECHDNNSLYDKLSFSNSEEGEEEWNKRIKFANSLIFTSCGIPFIHMGQEIGQSKFGLDNTYNIAKVNNMSWRLVDERFNMVERIRILSLFREQNKWLFNIDSLETINKLFKAEKWNNGVICLYAEDVKEVSNYQKAVILINPTGYSKNYELNEYYKKVTFGANDKANGYVKNGFLAPYSVQSLFVEK